MNILNSLKLSTRLVSAFLFVAAIAAFIGIVAILENHQLPDGTVRVPEGLRPYLGGLQAIEPVA